MAVAFDTVGPSSAGTGSATSPLTWSHTVTAGSNMALIAGCSLGASSVGTGFTMTATYNGVAMTSLGIKIGAGGNGLAQVWILVAPATGAAHNVVITKTVGGTIISLTGGSMSFSGVNQTTPTGTLVTTSGSTGTTASASVTGTTTGNQIFAVAAVGSAITTATTGTLRWKDNFSTASECGCAAGSSIASPGGTQAMSFSFTTDDWLIMAAELLAAPPAASAVYVPIVAPNTAVTMASTW